MALKNYPTRYVRVTVRPYRVKRYPERATEIVFTLPSAHAVQAVEMLMGYMGYGCSQYRIVSAEDVNSRYLKSNDKAQLRSEAE
jgi:hypothetical protein